LLGQSSIPGEDDCAGIQEHIIITDQGNKFCQNNTAPSCNIDCAKSKGDICKYCIRYKKQNILGRCPMLNPFKKICEDNTCTGCNEVESCSGFRDQECKDIGCPGGWDPAKCTCKNCPCITDSDCIWGFNNKCVAGTCIQKP